MSDLRAGDGGWGEEGAHGGAPDPNPNQIRMMDNENDQNEPYGPYDDDELRSYRKGRGGYDLDIEDARWEAERQAHVMGRKNLRAEQIHDALETFFSRFPWARFKGHIRSFLTEPRYFPLDPALAEPGREDGHAPPAA